MAAMEDESAVSHAGEPLPPSLDGKGLALCDSSGCPGHFGWQLRAWGDDHAASPQNMNFFFVPVWLSTFISIFPAAAGDFFPAPSLPFRASCECSDTCALHGS